MTSKLSLKSLWWCMNYSYWGRNIIFVRYTKGIHIHATCPDSEWRAVQRTKTTRRNRFERRHVRWMKPDCWFLGVGINHLRLDRYHISYSGNKWWWNRDDLNPTDCLPPRMASHDVGPTLKIAFDWLDGSNSTTFSLVWGQISRGNHPGCCQTWGPPVQR